LHARTVAYHGFPIDTGTVVALKLLDPDNRLPASVVSCNMYADRAETLVLGKAAADALRGTGKRAVAIAVTALSNRYFTEPIDAHEDRISSLKDDEWNRKILAILGEGRLEDVSQLARQFTLQANGDQKLKALWWLAALLGQNNDYTGEVLDYQAIWGTGAAVVRLVPTSRTAANLEFDEEDVDVYAGDRSVLSAGAAGVLSGDASDAAAASGADGGATATVARAGLMAAGAPAPVGAYPHARRVGDLLYLSGVGPREAGTNAIPGGPVRDTAGRPRPYDVAAQTRAAIANVRRILEAAGSSLERVLDVTVFLIDMQRDFETFNAVYAEAFAGIDATRTTIEVRALPTPIAVELKVIAAAGP
jgi:2-aminomuconate deaminase